MDIVLSVASHVNIIIVIIIRIQQFGRMEYVQYVENHATMIIIIHYGLREDVQNVEWNVHINMTLPLEFVQSVE